MDLRPPFDPIVRDFGLPATVTPPLGRPVSVRGIWINPDTTEIPVGGEARVAEPRRTLVLLRVAVSSVPRESRVAVAEHLGAPVRQWRVDGFGRVESEFLEVLLVPAP